MHLTEMAEFIGTEVVVDYQHAARRYTARLKDVETVEGAGDGGVFGSAHGEGPSPEAAQRGLAKSLAGKRITLDGWERGKRHIFNVPKNLSF